MLPVKLSSCCSCYVFSQQFAYFFLGKGVKCYVILHSLPQVFLVNSSIIWQFCCTIDVIFHISLSQYIRNGEIFWMNNNFNYIFKSCVLLLHVFNWNTFYSSYPSNMAGKISLKQKEQYLNMPRHILYRIQWLNSLQRWAKTDYMTSLTLWHVNFKDPTTRTATKTS